MLNFVASHGCSDAHELNVSLVAGFAELQDSEAAPRVSMAASGVPTSPTPPRSDRLNCDGARLESIRNHSRTYSEDYFSRSSSRCMQGTVARFLNTVAFGVRSAGSALAMAGGFVIDVLHRNAWLTTPGLAIIFIITQIHLNSPSRYTSCQENCLHLPTCRRFRQSEDSDESSESGRSSEC